MFTTLPQNAIYSIPCKLGGVFSIHSCRPCATANIKMRAIVYMELQEWANEGTIKLKMAIVY